MIMTDCTLCDNDEDTKVTVNIPLAKIDRRTKYYKIAIKEIMELNPKISHREAEEMFNKAYDKA